MGFYQLDTFWIFFTLENYTFVTWFLRVRATTANWLAALDAELFLLLRSYTYVVVVKKISGVGQFHFVLRVIK